MKVKQLLFTTVKLAVLVSMLAFLSSCEVDGCTNPNSENYDVDATQDDGSCILFREKFIGQYNVNETCPSGNYNFIINVVSSSTSEDAIIINNLGDFGAAVNATVDGSAVTIPNQNITSGGFAVSVNGSGAINGNLLTINYSYDFSGSGESCSMNCTKQ